MTYLGHPFAENDYPLPLEYNSNGEILLLPGSRIKSIEVIAPTILEAFRKISAEDDSLLGVIMYPSVAVVVCLKSIFETYTDLSDKVRLVGNDAEKLKVRGAIMSSGTISLTIALAFIPGVIIYKMTRLNYAMIRIFLKLRFIGLANLILDQTIYPELLQKEATVENIVNHFTPYLNEQESIDNFMDASNILKYKLIDEREKSASEWIEEQILK